MKGNDTMTKFKKNIDELTGRDFFYCYDMECNRFLKSKGFNYLMKAKSVKDSKIFTMFIRSSELNDCILEYKKMNSK